MGISLRMNSALLGIRRARIHAIRRPHLINSRTVTSMDPHRISRPALRAQGERGAPLRVPLLQKGNPGRNLTSLLHAAPHSLAPVALGDFLVLFVGVVLGYFIFFRNRRYGSFRAFTPKLEVRTQCGGVINLISTYKFRCNWGL